jgi:ABC-type branched-subunit amino acid transport system ATPase component
MMKAIIGICHRVIVLNAGKKITEGNPREVVLNREVIEAFLGEDQDAED